MLHNKESLEFGSARSCLYDHLDERVRSCNCGDRFCYPIVDITFRFDLVAFQELGDDNAIKKVGRTGPIVSLCMTNITVIIRYVKNSIILP